MTKKTTLLISLLFSLFFIIFILFQQHANCSFIQRSCSDLLGMYSEIIFIFIPVFIFSLFTYKMKDDVYNIWIKFVYIWIPLTIIMSFITPEYGKGGFLFPIERGGVSYFLSLLFFIISIIIISVKYFSAKKSN